MSEERQRGGAARYLAMVACVLLGGFVYVGWRIKKGDELQKQHTLAAGIERNINGQELDLSLNNNNSERLYETQAPSDEDLLSNLTIGNNQEEPTRVIDTPDDIDIEALLTATSEEPTNQGIGGVAGNSNAGIVLPETEFVSQPDMLPPMAPAPDSYTQAPPPSADFLAPTPPAVDPTTASAPETLPANTTDEEIVSAPALTATSYREYKVKRGDTLSKIASNHLGSRKRANEIFAMNRDIMSSPNLLKVGMKLKVPFDRNSNRTSNHKITTTDSLPSIAMRYYGSAEPEMIEGIRLANPILSQGGFREGTQLKIPPIEIARETPVEIYANTPAGKERLYIVRSGDTLSKIAAKKYGNANKWRSIFNANKDQIRKPSSIRVGMSLRLP